jgi:hypothetical protein
MLRLGDEMVRAASPHAHRHLTIHVPNRDSIWKYEPSDAVADDVPHETGVVERIRLDRVHPVKIAKQGARNRCCPHIRADVDHGASDGQLACLEDFGEWQATPYGEAMRNPFGIVRLGGHPPRETRKDDTVDVCWRCISIGERVPIRRATGHEGRFARLPPVVIRREHRRVAQREDVLEHGFVGLYRADALPPGIESPAQRVAVSFRALQALGENVALAAALFEFGTQPPAAGQMPDKITNEPPEPGH